MTNKTKNRAGPKEPPCKTETRTLPSTTPRPTPRPQRPSDPSSRRPPRPSSSSTAAVKVRWIERGRTTRRGTSFGFWRTRRRSTRGTPRAEMGAGRASVRAVEGARVDSCRRRTLRSDHMACMWTNMLAMDEKGLNKFYLPSLGHIVVMCLKYGSSRRFKWSCVESCYATNLFSVK